jgi:hypothetical protein
VARARDPLVDALPQEPLRHLLEPVVARRDSFGEYRLDERPEFCGAPRVACRVLGREYFAHARSLEERARCGGIVARIITRREPVVELRAEIRWIVAKEGAGHIYNLLPPALMTTTGPAVYSRQ